MSDLPLVICEANLPGREKKRKGWPIFLHGRRLELSICGRIRQDQP